MCALDYRTAGESHGQALVTLIEGMPAGVPINLDFINAELARRQGGYGRGGRMKIERDTVNIRSGVRRGVTIGSPIAIEIANRDYRIDAAPAVHRPERHLTAPPSSRNQPYPHLPWGYRSTHLSCKCREVSQGYRNRVCFHVPTCT